MQSIGSTPCDSYPTVGSVLHAGLPAVRPPFEESAIPTCFLRGCKRNVEFGKRGPPIDPGLAFPFLFGSWRFYASYQHDCWCYDYRPHLHRWVILPVQLIGAPQERTIAILFPHLAPSILHEAEVHVPVFLWRLSSQTVSAHGHGSLPGTACDGGH